MIHHKPGVFGTTHLYPLLIAQECIYTALSIYVVGSKPQAYATRPKDSMGRLELILGFRGCWREMDMEAENTISIALRV